MNLIVMGYGGHGKDTVCEILRDRYGLTFESSSHFAMRLGVVAPYLAEQGITYPDFEAMYADRGNHRAVWHEAIRAYNTPDSSRLGKELFGRFNIYCGLRNIEEFEAMKAERLFDAAVWVDASERLPVEGADSCTVTPDLADIVIDNNGPLDALSAQIERAWWESVAHEWANAALAR